MPRRRSPQGWWSKVELPEKTQVVEEDCRDMLLMKCESAWYLANKPATALAQSYFATDRYLPSDSIKSADSKYIFQFKPHAWWY